MRFTESNLPIVLLVYGEAWRERERRVDGGRALY